MSAPAVDVVIPTIGRASLGTLLIALADTSIPPPGRILLVDDRRRRDTPLPLGPAARALDGRVAVLASHGRGPAAARNLGWRAARTEWVAFLDDDVVPCREWADDLLADVAVHDAGVAGSQGVVRVPLPATRAPTDRERVVHGLERAQWASANIAYRRRALERVGGFDERFPRAYREDADLGLRLASCGLRIVRGRRCVVHPAAPAGRWSSVAAQAGNADDALMRALHGSGWRRRAGAPHGRLPRHLLVTAAGAAALAGAAHRAWRLAALGLAAWIGGTAEFAWRRIAPGPRSRAEVMELLLTSPCIPPLAVAHRLLGELRALRLAGAGRARARARPRVDAVLFDRDGTLVHDVPYNGDPAAVRPVPGAAAAVRRLRAAGVRLAVVTNQGAIGEGRLGARDVDAVNAHIDRTIGPFDGWFVCPHDAAAGCRCRKPAPGLVERALHVLGVAPERSVLVGDTAADLEAARAANVRGILVPNAVTRRAEVAAAPEVAASLEDAVARLLEEPR